MMQTNVLDDIEEQFKKNGDTISFYARMDEEGMAQGTIPSQLKDDDAERRGVVEDVENNSSITRSQNEPLPVGLVTVPVGRKASTSVDVGTSAGETLRKKDLRAEARQHAEECLKVEEEKKYEKLLHDGDDEFKENNAIYKNILVISQLAISKAAGMVAELDQSKLRKSPNQPEDKLKKFKAAPGRRRHPHTSSRAPRSAGQPASNSQILLPIEPVAQFGLGSLPASPPGFCASGQLAVHSGLEAPLGPPETFHPSGQPASNSQPLLPTWPLAQCGLGSPTASPPGFETPLATPETCYSSGQSASSSQSLLWPLDQCGLGSAPASPFGLASPTENVALTVNETWDMSLPAFPSLSSTLSSLSNVETAHYQLPIFTDGTDAAYLNKFSDSPFLSNTEGGSFRTYPAHQPPPGLEHPSASLPQPRGLHDVNEDWNFIVHD
eukprot:TRINITY_DN16513_c0_g1_i1.p1 TRINITY_DN16513_c0_g1~~TRINITY_DN16513_c0_g1_i1.p1  ORF type:complete len:438 (-),score=71.19 TRINITY_DN16513_c0_g1_i1:203-1516(-)